MLLTLAVAGAVALVPGLLYGGYRIRNARGEALAWATPAGRENLRTYRELFGMAEDPGARLLTDCGPIALHQKERAPFVDPWLFREMVDTGRIRPDRLRRELGTGWYDLVISTADWNRPEYAANPFGLPMVLVQAARRRYQPAGTRAGLFVYVPRGDARRPEAAARPGGSDPRSGPRKRRPRRRRAPTKPRRIPLGSRRLVFPRKLGRGPG
jgi:hypothetical protein